ncbi:MAG: electron transfer flavoprotein subunit alpha/FixB family protein [Chloroflexi bacterium]|nr:electron transfer flavoprotein subunit alpha/FixB family protein [Chloroflexota bacterium]
MAGVLVLVAAVNQEPSPAAVEVVGAARRLADDLGNQPVSVLVAGKLPSGAWPGEHGADRVLIAQDSGSTPTSADWLLAAAREAVRAVEPSVILLPHNADGRDLGPRLAARLDTGIVTDATALRVEDGRLVVTKPVFGGSAIAEYAIASSPQMATLRPRAFEEQAAASTGRSAEESGLNVPPVDSRVQVLEEVAGEVTTGPRLKDAKIIVSGGRGLGGPENWHYVDELAEVLGAAVGATRAVTDAGWVAPSLQVGLTGVSVAPDLYITIGISGAVQHIAGISGARNVVAINRDRDANIFKYARFGVVGDWKQIVPAFTERLRQLRAG